MKQKTLLALLSVFFIFAIVFSSCEKKDEIKETKAIEATETSTVVEALVEPTQAVEPEEVVAEHPINASTTGYKGISTPELLLFKDGKYYNPDTNKFTGYYYPLNNKWIPGVITIQSQFFNLPNYFVGGAIPYDYNLMEATAEANGFSLDDVKGGVALMSCSEIGNYVWLKRPNYDWEGPFRVVDCAGYDDQYNVVVNNNEAVEIGFKTAQEWGMVASIDKTDASWNAVWNSTYMEDVMVSKVNPNCIPDDVEFVNFESWFLEHVEFYQYYEDYQVHVEYNHKPIPHYFETSSEWFIDGEWVQFEYNSIECVP